MKLEPAYDLCECNALPTKLSSEVKAEFGIYPKMEKIEAICEIAYF